MKTRKFPSRSWTTPVAACLLGSLLYAGIAAAVAPPPGFGTPVISGIAGTGFEQGLRVDPSDPTRIYTSAPGTAAEDASWIWRSLDAGKTFKWVPAALPLQGKVTFCNGGGDSELAVDSAGHVYFADLTLANFSTSRSDDHGVNFTCSNTGVPDAVVDRQWYTLDGDPTNGGTLYLTNDEVAQGGVDCEGNVLVMYRSPPGGVGATAGIQFGPANRITPTLGCDEGIMGNNEVSPVATTLGQPNGLGGYAVLPVPVKHVFVVHDDINLHKIRVARCFPVAFGAPVANASDPSGLNCTDTLAADLGPNVKTGGNFPSMAVDRAGNLYTVWEQAPIDASGVIVGDTVLKYSWSTDQGRTWTAPMSINTAGSPVGTLHNNVMAWIVAGDNGRVDIAWYGTASPGNPNDPTCGVNAPLPPAQGKNINGPDSATGAFWSLWMVQSVNAHALAPTFTTPIIASEHFSHRGTIQSLMGGQCGDRMVGDFLQLRMGAKGEAEISYADTTSLTGALAAHSMFVRQNSGSGLLAAYSPVSIPGLARINRAPDWSGDGTYNFGSFVSYSMPQLDIVKSSVALLATAPCSVVAPCYQVTQQLNYLSLAPAPSDPDTDLVWLTQWFEPSTTEATGGKDFIVYAESNNGGALQCYVGENAATLVGGGTSMTYPGNYTLPAENCLMVPGPLGTITIDVPVAAVTVGGAVDNRLHQVTASTMTLPQPANTNPSLGGVGGMLFNLIDVVQVYTFDPAAATCVPVAGQTNCTSSSTGTIGHDERDDDDRDGHHEERDD